MKEMVCFGRGGLGLEVRSRMLKFGLEESRFAKFGNLRTEFGIVNY